MLDEIALRLFVRPVVGVVSVKSGYVMNRGLPLSYLEWGRQDAPVVVLSGPFRNPAYEWRHTAELLQDGFRVIAVNLRGQGDSAPFPARKFDPNGYVEDLKAIVEGLNLAPAVIVGFSVVMSGVAVAFASAYPEQARGIVLVDGGLGYSKEQASVAGERARSMPSSFPDWEAAHTYFAQMVDQSFASSEDIEERVAYSFRRLTDGTVVWKSDPVLRELWPGEDFERNTGAQPPEVWERVQCPILVAKGAAPKKGREHLSVEGCEEIVKYGSAGCWVAVPNVTSHFVHEENPTGFVGVIRPFLEKVYGV
jgi:pimeloyl-ACP methyl ester carboxylesterase